MRAILLAAALLATPALAVQPDEMLADPKLEARARALSKEIRCLVCRSESIDDSNADWARDIRLAIRERIDGGASDAEVKTFLVDRFGEYILLKPQFSAGNALLWLSGPLLLIVGGAAAFIYLRRQRTEIATAEAPLSAEERATLDRALRDD